MILMTATLKTTGWFTYTNIHSHLPTTTFSRVFLNFVFASDFKITANVICQLTDTSVFKLPLFQTAHFIYTGEKSTQVQWMA